MVKKHSLFALIVLICLIIADYMVLYVDQKNMRSVADRSNGLLSTRLFSLPIIKLMNKEYENDKKQSVKMICKNIAFFDL